MSAPPPRPTAPALVDVVDRLFDRGVVLRGDLMLGVAGVDLVYVGLQALIASPDVVDPPILRDTPTLAREARR